jgi:hypothetical protein
MAEDPVRKRTRRAAKRIERQRRKALAARTRKAAEVPRSPAQTPREQRGPGFPDLPPPPPIWPDDLEGGAGVREPRRPYPTMPADALELNEPEPQYLEMSSELQYSEVSTEPDLTPDRAYATSRTVDSS